MLIFLKLITQAFKIPTYLTIIPHQKKKLWPTQNPIHFRLLTTCILTRRDDMHFDAYCIFPRENGDQGSKNSDSSSEAVNVN